MRRIVSSVLAMAMVCSLMGPVNSYAKTNGDSKTIVSDIEQASETDAQPGKTGLQSVDAENANQANESVNEETAIGENDPNQQGGSNDPNQQGGSNDPNQQGGNTDPVDPTVEVTYTAVPKADKDGNIKILDETYNPEEIVTKEEERIEVATKDTTSDRIYYINLDDGESNYTSDAIIIESNGHFGLIDASNRFGDTSQVPHTAVGRNASGKIVLDYLEALGVEHLDFVIGTHSHSDHMGGIVDIVTEMENVYGTKSSQTISTVDNENTTLTYAADGKEVTDEEILKAVGDEEASKYDPVVDEDPVKFTLVDEKTTYVYKSYTANSEEDSKGWNNSGYFTDASNSLSMANKLVVDKTNTSSLLKLGDGGATYSNNGTAADTTDDNITFKFGDYTISLYNLVQRSTTDENANSIVTYIEKAGTKTVLLSDLDVYDSLEQRISKAIVAAHGTPSVVKVGHHGFTASTSKELCDTFSPKYAIVQTENRDLGSYSPFYNYLRRRGTTIYRTFDQAGKQAIVQDMTSALNFKTATIGELEQGVEEYQLSTEYKTASRFTKTYTVTKTTTTTTPVTGGDPTVTEDKEDFEVVRTIYEDNARNEIVSVSRYTGLEYGDAPAAWVWTAKEGRWYKWWKSWNSYDWVFVNADGTNAVGWTRINGLLYFFDENGIMEHGFHTYDGCKVFLLPENYGSQPEGSTAIGWMLIEGKWYFFDGDGKGHKGWLNNNGDWYFIDEGEMVTGVREIKGVAYRFGADGKLATGWVNAGDDWFYITGSGQYATGWMQVDGTWYCMDGDGRMRKSEWVDGCWLGSDGSWSYKSTASWHANSKGWWYQDTSGWYPSNCWQLIDGKWYYFDGSGYMASNEWRGGCWLSGDGSWSYKSIGSWHSNGSGWWFSDESGWYASNCWQKINGNWYYFKGDGYMATSTTVDGYTIGADGICK